MPSELHAERHEAALVLSLSESSGRQGLSDQLLAAGVEALDVAESDPTVRTVVLRGEGGDFCAPCDAAQPGRASERLLQLVEALRVFPKPVIAAVEGRAVDAGFALVLGCDLVVASDNAEFVVTPAPASAQWSNGIAWHLGGALPKALAQQILWLPTPLSAEQLHRHGLVNRVTGIGQALSDALGLAQQLAAVPADALAEAKEWLAATDRMSWQDHLKAHQGLSAESAPNPLPLA